MSDENPKRKNSYYFVFSFYTLVSAPKANPKKFKLKQKNVFLSRPGPLILLSFYNCCFCFLAF